MDFRIDGKALTYLEQLRDKFDAKTVPEMISKCIAIAVVAAELAHEDNSVTLLGKNGETKQIFLNQ